MPAHHTHYLIAEEILSELPENIVTCISSLPDYYAGAQGGDAYFFTKLTTGEKNLGQAMHRRHIRETFDLFLEKAREGDGAVCSYAAGYITHYVADSVFHPFVYALCGKLLDEGGTGIAYHQYIESSLDSYFIRGKTGEEPGRYRLAMKVRGVSCGKLFPMLQKTAGLHAIRLSERAFRRSFRRFLLYVRFFHDTHYRKGAFFRKMEKFLHARGFLSCLCCPREADGRCLNESREEWENPSVPGERFRESADDLFARAVGEGVRLITEFFRAADHDVALDASDFRNGFLTGADESVPLANPAEKKVGNRQKNRGKKKKV